MNTIEIVSFEDCNAEKQELIANTISQYTNGMLEESPQMLPVTPEEVFKKTLGYVAISDNHFAGYVSASMSLHWRNQKMTEVGTLWVPQEYRKRGIAHNLVGLVTKKVNTLGLVPYAFCNSLSESVFKDSGYEVSGACSVPVSAFDLCKGCPKKPTSGCCDKIMIAKGAKS